MSYRGGGITGTNNIPLGNRRRFGGDRDSGNDEPRNKTEDAPPKRGRSIERSKYNLCGIDAFMDVDALF